jgi:hypothetical protein
MVISKCMAIEQSACYKGLLLCSSRENVLGCIESGNSLQMQ